MSRGSKRESGGAKGARRANEAAPDSARGGKGRWSARRKVTVVLELLRERIRHLEDEKPFLRWRSNQ